MCGKGQYLNKASGTSKGECAACPAGTHMPDANHASQECKEVTCLYHDVNWWVEGLVSGEEQIEPAPETGDYFL